MQELRASVANALSGNPMGIVSLLSSQIAELTQAVASIVQALDDSDENNVDIKEAHRSYSNCEAHAEGQRCVVSAAKLKQLIDTLDGNAVSPLPKVLSKKPEKSFGSSKLEIEARAAQEAVDSLQQQNQE